MRFFKGLGSLFKKAFKSKAVKATAAAAGAAAVASILPKATEFAGAGATQTQADLARAGAANPAVLTAGAAVALAVGAAAVGGFIIWAARR